MTGRKEVLFREAYERFLKTKESSTDHYNIERCMFKLFGVGEWKEKVYCWPQDIMVHQLHDGLLADLTEARLSEGLQPASVNVELRNIRRVFNYAVSSLRAKLPEEPFKIKLLKVKAKTRFIKLSEERLILETLNKGKGRTWELAHDLYLFLVDTGVRISEALAIRKKDIDWDEGTITIYRSKTDNLGTVALTPRLRPVVERRLKDCKAPTDLLFQRTNRAIKYLRRVIHTICNKDPVEVKRHGRATIHSLRDTYASRLVMSNVSLYTVSRLLGHASLQMTRKYAHLEVKTKAKEAAEVLSSAVMSSSNEM